MNFPTRRDLFDPLDVNKRNNSIVRDGEMDIETLEVHVRQLQKAVGAKFDAYDTESHEARLRLLAAAIDDALSAVGDGLGREGKQVFVFLGNNLEFVPSGPGGASVIGLKSTITGDHSIVGYLTTSKAVRAEDGHGQFIDAPSVSAGKANLRNGIVRLYCIDTANYIELESPDDISANRKQYLQNKDGKIVVEENDGMINTSLGYRVAGHQVVGERLPPIAVTSESPVGTATDAGVGFESKEQFDNFVAYVDGLRQDIQALHTVDTTHGLVATE